MSQKAPIVSLESVRFPKKGPHRQRAHCNPLSDTYSRYPQSVDFVDWSVHYPRKFSCKCGKKVGEDQLKSEWNLKLNTDLYPIEYDQMQCSCVNGAASRTIDFLDIGCGFGGMTYALAHEFPDKLVLGLEIREKVTTFVGKKIIAYRARAAGAAIDEEDDEVVVDADLSPEHPQQPSNRLPLKNSKDETPDFQNASVIRTNVMKFLPNYIRKGSVERIFILFPDPHFKRSVWRRRIVTPELLSTYAYHLKEDGLLYFITDVEELYKWMVLSCEQHPLFERISGEGDKAYDLMHTVTDEGKKAIRLGKNLYAAIWKKRASE